MQVKSYVAAFGMCEQFVNKQPINLPELAIYGKIFIYYGNSLNKNVEILNLVLIKNVN